MNYSAFGTKFTAKSGIVDLMDDLGTALNENPEMLFMGGGNPGRVPEIEDFFQGKLENIANDEDKRHSLLGIYQSPQGEKEFREQLASYLKTQFNWQISSKNIAISNGSQSAFFLIYNMLAGEMQDGSKKTIHFPLAPEYIGYADAGLSDNFFTSTQPAIEEIDQHTFKYHVDFSQLTIDDSIAALSVSRPTNPTGNVITDEEIIQTATRWRLNEEGNMLMRRYLDRSTFRSCDPGQFESSASCLLFNEREWDLKHITTDNYHYMRHMHRFYDDAYYPMVGSSVLYSAQTDNRFFIKVDTRPVELPVSNSSKAKPLSIKTTQDFKSLVTRELEKEKR